MEALRNVGKVKLAFHKDTSMKVAVKIVTKETMSQKPNMRKKLEREIAIMKLISHPSVLRFLDVYETTKYLYASQVVYLIAVHLLTLGGGCAH